MNAHRTRRIGALAAALVLATGLGLVACSTDGDQAAETVGPDRPAGGEALSEQDAGAADEAEAASDGTQRSDERVLLEDRSVIATGEVSLRTEDVADTRTDVHNLVRRYDGHIDADQTRTDDEGDPIRSDLVLRIPTEDFTGAVADLEQLAELADSSTRTEDVTTEVVDTNVRVRAQRRSLERLEQLLAEAESLDQIIRIEDELTRRQADLASLERQQERLAEATSMSTITVTLRRVEEREETVSAAGFVGGLSAGWAALVAFGTGLFTVVGFALPWLPLLGLVLLPGWLLARRLRRDRVGVPPVEPATSE